MDLYQLRCFVIAAEELHFGRAARKLEILPSVFGRNVRLLEEDLGTKLFLRTTRSIVLSEDGEQLLRDARKLIALAGRRSGSLPGERSFESSKAKSGRDR